jgi:hypothetical protein
MADITSTVLLTFPVRPPTDGERDILRCWIAAADGFSAFVSERRGDDPGLYRRIVISRRRTKQRAYIVQAPQGRDVWIVVSAIDGDDIGRFLTLREALNFVQPALADLAPTASPSGKSTSPQADGGQSLVKRAGAGRVAHSPLHQS